MFKPVKKITIIEVLPSFDGDDFHGAVARVRQSLPYKTSPGSKRFFVLFDCRSAKDTRASSLDVFFSISSNSKTHAESSISFGSALLTRPYSVTLPNLVKAQELGIVGLLMAAPRHRQGYY
ncbi:MAG: hypothetical protein WC782_13775 [Methylococcaceae bacterium]